MGNNDQATGDDAASATLLSTLLKQRSSSKGSITRIKKLLEERGSSLNSIDLECRLEILNSYIKQLMAYQTEIEKITPDDSKRGELEEVCISTKSLLLMKLGKGRRSSVLQDCTMGVPMPPSNRLPLLKIPKFNGKYSEYKNFISCFNNLVNDDPTLSTIEKFNHLIACLQDDALRTVKAFQVNEENYANALKRLAERYDNNCLIFQDHIASLFNLKKMNKGNASDLRQIVDTVSAILDSLSSLGTDKDITHAVVIHLVLSKLDNESKSKWDEQLDYATLPKWSDCASVLIRRCQFLEINEDRSLKSEQDNCPPNKGKSNATKDKKRSQFSFSCTQEQNDLCALCAGSDHFIASCPMFSTLNVTQRFEYTKRKGLCINCLKVGHSVKKCRNSRCNICQRPHHFMLHNQDLIRRNESSAIDVSNSIAATSSSSAQRKDTAAANSSSAQCSDKYSNRGSNNATSMYVEKSDHQVILATAMIQIMDKRGEYKLARALLDSGSQVNLVTEEIAQRISVNRVGKSLNLIGVGNGNHTIKQCLSTFVKSCVNEFEFKTEFFIITSIASPQPHGHVDRTNLRIPSNIVLADPQFYKQRKIDLLIGAELFFELLSVGQIKLGPFLPTLQKTLLGWVVSGKYEMKSSPKTQLCQLTVSCEEQTLKDLHHMVQNFWELEQVPDNGKISEEHLMCESHFENTTQRTNDGRFEVRLPIKTDPEVLGHSYETCKRRFLSLESRLSANPKMRQMYMDFMHEYVSLGHMTPTDNIIPRSAHYFVPHQCVIREHSTTTKLRVVFDASCKTSTQKSLNDVLMVGPTIQNDLFSTLLRFRLNKYAITADITKMFRQVIVHEDDRKYQMILWRENPTLPLQMYELNTVTYGTAPAPFLAIRCLKEISHIFKAVYPLGSEAIATDFYVDDFLSGADNVEILNQIRTEVNQILSTCGFTLAKWHSNCNENSDKRQIAQFEFNDAITTRALGIIWKTEEDVLVFQLENNFENLPATKRNILSVSSRLFDPLGLLAPIIITAKILLQELWESNLDWDESIPQNLDTTWKNIKTVLSQLNLIEIPRFVGTTFNAHVEIHGFADASMRAYGCCLYVVSRSNKGTTSQLLVAKSKVAPARKVKTLPRLELCAAHLLSKLWTVVKSRLSKFSIDVVTFWVDSEIVLHWLKTHPSSLTTFVCNRVAYIQEKTEGYNWRHVPTSVNPADIVSRGCDVDEIKRSIWFTGPEFLKLGPELWPKNPHFEFTTEMLALEKKKSKCTLLSSRATLYNSILKVIEKCSCYKKIIRIVAYILRFIRCARNKCRVKNDLLEVMELDIAFLKIIQMIQHMEFREDIEGAAGLWSEKTKTRIQQVSAERGIEFKFIPPRAPHFGGLWEAAVKSAKHLMLRTIGTANLTFEELTTVLVDVEAVLNSRPIAGMTEDPNDELALTPGHLLIGCSLKALPGVDELTNKGGSLKRFRILFSLKEHFWDVWRRDYVRDLQSRHKWKQPADNIEVGNVVLIHEDNLPPQRWLIGKVEETEVSEDGKVRVASIKTTKGVYRRPIHKLALIPIEEPMSVAEEDFCNGASVASK